MSESSVESDLLEKEKKKTKPKTLTVPHFLSIPLARCNLERHLP
jgi:hypothetical protein